MPRSRSCSSEAGQSSPTPLTELKFHKLSEHTLEDLVERLEPFVEDAALEDADLEYSQGVLTLKLGELGTYVLNKQTPNKQIWMSSPVSGPVRYDYEFGSWVYRRDGHKMHERLESELKQLTGAEVELNPCTTCERLSTCVDASQCPA